MEAESERRPGVETQHVVAWNTTFPVMQRSKGGRKVEFLGILPNDDLTGLVVPLDKRRQCFLVGRHPFIPPTLMDGTFSVGDALHAGLTRRQLQGSSWRRLGPGQYAWAGLEEIPELVLASARRRLPPAAAFSGRTAAWRHGLDFAPCDPIEATIPKGRGSSALVGLAIRQASLTEADVVVRRGMPTTSAMRTVFDLGSLRPLVEAVVGVDIALHEGLVQLTQALATRRCQLWTQRCQSSAALHVRRCPRHAGSGGRPGAQRLK